MENRNRPALAMYCCCAHVSSAVSAPNVALPLFCCPELIPSISRLLHSHAQANEHIDAGAVKDLVKLVQRGSESASAAGAAHALAVFTTGKNASTYRASVQTAGGVPALLTWVFP